MQPTDSAPLATAPLYNRADVVLRHLLAALVVVPLGALAGSLAGPALGAGSLASSGAVAASLALLASIVWRWRGRFELHADHLAHGRGSALRRVPLDDVKSVEVSLYEPYKGVIPDAYATLRVAVKGAAPVVIFNRKLSQLGPIVDRLVGVVADRAEARLAQGDEVHFADRPRFPFVLAGVFGVLSMGVVALLAAAVTGHILWTEILRNVRGVGFFVVFVSAAVVPALRAWWNARRSMGVALSSQGLRPLADAELAARASRGGAPFRAAMGEAAGWIPWTAIRALEQTQGYAVTFHLHTRPEPLVLSRATRDLPVLLELVRRQERRMYPPLQAYPSGVRVAAYGAPSEPAQMPVAADDARRREG